MFSYSGLLIAMARASQGINSNIVGAIINGLGALVPIGLFIFYASARLAPPSPNAVSGFSWALFGGLCLVIFTLSITLLFALGEDVSFVTPLIYGFAILSSSAIAVLFFSERPSLSLIAGLILIALGMALIGYSKYLNTDKSTKSTTNQGSIIAVKERW